MWKAEHAPNATVHRTDTTEDKRLRIEHTQSKWRTRKLTSLAEVTEVMLSLHNVTFMPKLYSCKAKSVENIKSFTISQPLVW